MCNVCTGYLFYKLYLINFVYLDPPPFFFDESLMSELTQMGFPVEACKRALFFTKNNGLNDASNWLMEHISDSDFSNPFTFPGTESKSGKKVTTLNCLTLLKFVFSP